MVRSLPRVRPVDHPAGDGGPERLGRALFRGGTGQAIPRAAGVGGCTGPVPAGVLTLRAAIAHQEPQQLLLEPLSGQPRLLSCGEGDAGCR